MTFPAMHPSASVVTPVTRESVSSRVLNAASLVVHGGFSHSHSSSSQANTSAALSSHRASIAATAAAAHSECVFDFDMALSFEPIQPVSQQVIQ